MQDDDYPVLPSQMDEPVRQSPDWEHKPGSTGEGLLRLFKFLWPDFVSSSFSRWPWR
jgi:hypothetical protein